MLKTGSGDDAPGRARESAQLLQQGERRGDLRRGGGPSRVDERERGGERVPRGLLQLADEPRLARPVDRRDLRGRDVAGFSPGLATYGRHIGAGSSYGAFIAALGHIASRLHAIGNQARQAIKTEPYKPYFLICAHAGVKTGEDGPTHADPQALQILQENFPKGTMITLTPWDPQELFPARHGGAEPAAVRDRAVRHAAQRDRPRQKSAGARAGDRVGDGCVSSPQGQAERAAGTLVLQGSEVAYAFVTEALPLLAKEGIDLDVYYVASAELFDALSPEEQEKIFPKRAGAGDDGDHRLHARHDVPVGVLGAGAARRRSTPSRRGTIWGAVRRTR